MIPASQTPVADAPVSVGLTTSIPNDISWFWPGPVELFETFNPNVALVADTEVRVKSTVADSAVPSQVVEYRIEPVSFTPEKDMTDA